jgi:hypothetical protein
MMIIQHQLFPSTMKHKLCIHKIWETKNIIFPYLIIQSVQLESGPYFNMSNLFTKVYNMLHYTTNLYLQKVLEMMSIHFNALIDTFHHVPRNFS